MPYDGADHTSEPLYILNRSGNRPSHEHAPLFFDMAIEQCRAAGFRKVLLRGDTDFSLTENFDRWSEDNVQFVFGMDVKPNLVALAETLEKETWKPLRRSRSTTSMEKRLCLCSEWLVTTIKSDTHLLLTSTIAMLTLLHLSDLHFGPPYLPQVGEAVLRLAAELSPDTIVVSGDFTQRAKRHQFEEARAFLDRLPPANRVLVPGNHDVPLFRVVERLKSPLGLYQEFIEGRLNYSVKGNGAVIAALDSTTPRRAITNGRIHTAQLDFCSEVFSGVPDETVKIVVAHHHFAGAPDYEWDRTMPKAKRAIDRFVDLKVDLILGGHLHRAYIGNTLDIYAGRHRDRGIIIVQCGTSTSHRGRGKECEKNSLNIVCVESGKLHVTHYMYFHDRDRFEPVSRHTFPRPGRQFNES